VILEDIAFPVDRLGDALTDLQSLFSGFDYDNAIIFGHAKDGNIHFVITQSFGTKTEPLRWPQNAAQPPGTFRSYSSCAANKPDEVQGTTCDGYYSTAVSCELAMSEATGKAYASVLQLAERALSSPAGTQ